MKKHTKVYFEAFGYDVSDTYIPSELSNQPAVDIHHIDSRGMGGAKKEDRIEELMALTREEHVKYGDKKQWMVWLYNKHMNFLKANGVKFDEEYILEKMRICE